MIRIGVCDDDKVILKFLELQLIKYATITGNQFQVNTYTSGTDLLANHKANPFSFIMMDIMMPGENGIEIGRRLREFDTNVPVVYLTSSPDYALDAYSVKAVYYLMKPIKPADLTYALDQLMSFFTTPKRPCVCIPVAEGNTKVFIDTIIFVEHIQHVLYFHLQNGSIIATANSSLTLAKALWMLSEKGDFSQPHRAYIINWAYVTSVTGQDIIMSNGYAIPIPSRRICEIKQEYQNYLSTHHE